MKTKIMKNLFAALTMTMIIAPMFALSLVALPTQAQEADLWGEQEGAIDDSIGLGSEDPRVIIARVINIALGFLGIVAVVIILLAGFKWMTGGGNEDKIEEAKKLLTAGVIGLVIILAAWGIATFVVNRLYDVTSGV